MLTSVLRFTALASKNPGGGAGVSQLKSDPMEDVVVSRLTTRSPGGGAG